MSPQPRRSDLRERGGAPRSSGLLQSVDRGNDPGVMDDVSRGVHTEVWMAIARHTPLGILCDLDGTLVPFASSPDEARPDEPAVQLVTDLATLPGVTVAIVSGRPKDWLESFFPGDQVFLVAEHGALRRGAGAWE